MRSPLWVERLALLVLLAWVTACHPRPGPARPMLVPPGSEAMAVSLPGIENGWRIGPRLWSGGEPSSDEAFAALAAQGVRVLVSVDGARPNLEAARRHGLRYVHVPIGYEGIPRAAVEELASVAWVKEGGVFVHCHHGHHRGPTAAAIVAIASGAWDRPTAHAWQRAAGTSPEYAGLGMDYKGWVDYKRRINPTSKFIKVGITEKSIFLYPGEPDLIVVTFRQQFRSDNQKRDFVKRQYWRMEKDGRWRIVYEGSVS